MNRYAILNQNNVVINTTVADTPLAAGWIELGDDSPVSVGWTFSIDEFYPPAEPLNVFLKNISVTVNELPAQFFAGNYYANVKDSVKLTADLVNSAGELQTAISFPISLKLPVVRHANGTPTTDEVYMNFTIVDGKATATVEIERSGDWKILIDRLNTALSRMFASVNAPISQQFVVKADDITIIA